MLLFAVAIAADRRCPHSRKANRLSTIRLSGSKGPRRGNNAICDACPTVRRIRQAQKERDAEAPLSIVGTNGLRRRRQFRNAFQPFRRFGLRQAGQHTLFALIVGSDYDDMTKVLRLFEDASFRRVIFELAFDCD
jgi:hypothetical protein